MDLLGPPELRNSNASNQQDASASITDHLTSLMVANFNKITVAGRPPMGLTKNGSGTYLSSGNPCLDFFFQVVPITPPETLTRRLHTAWAHDPLTTLKLVCNLRGVRGTGKSDKEGFYTAALWLHKLHPKTLACNVASFAEFGYYKDLLEIIYRVLEGPEVRKIQKQEWQRRKSGGKRKINSRKCNKRRKGNKKPAITRELRIANATQRNKLEKKRASELRNERKLDMAKKVIAIYSSEPDFRFLYDRVSDYFAECLKNDMKLYESGEVTKISLAAKWCPSIDSSFDRAMLICESIARKVFPKELYVEYEGIEDVHYAYRVRDRLRKEVLVPLRKVLELPEVYISAKKMNSLPYNRVPSVAMTLYKEKFLKQDPIRFSRYLKGGRAENAKNAAAAAAGGACALLPNEIIRCLDHDDAGQVAELLWKKIVNGFKKKGKFGNCMAICDVSNRMNRIALDVSVAMGVLVSELSEEPWKGKLITFSENPELKIVEGNNLRSRIEFVSGMKWGRYSNFQKVFDLILKVAVDGNLDPGKMIKRVFVFSNMQFDKASANPWETDYQMIVKKYTEKGYGSVVPEMIFWNLSGYKSTPVPGTQKGVALVSGFSKNLLTLFLENEGEFNPEQIMEAAISGEEYQKLVVVD